MNEVLTLDDIIEEMKETGIGYTMIQLKDRLDWGEKKIGKAVKKAVHSGHLKVFKQEVLDSIGRRNYTYVYYAN